MMIDWLKWCRLCGSEESSYSVEMGTKLADVIHRCFTITITNSSSLVVCGTCNEFLVSLQNFCVQVDEVDKMYKELLSGYQEKILEENLREIRQKYGLDSSSTVQIEKMPIKNEVEVNESNLQSENNKRRRKCYENIKVLSSFFNFYFV